MRGRSWPALWLAIACGIAAATQASEKAPVPRSYVLGGGWSYSFRNGYFDIRGFEQDSAGLPLSLWGVWGGKRYEFAPWLRLQVCLAVQWGSVDYDTIRNVQLTDGTLRDEVAMTEDLFRFTASPELHYRLPAYQALAPYLSMGAGIDYMSMRGIGRANGAGLFREAIGFEGAVDMKKIIADLRGGAGIDIRIGAVAFDAGYVFTYWSPVAYTFERDMPLHGVKYWEAFRTHEVRVGLVWGR